MLYTQFRNQQDSVSDDDLSKVEDALKIILPAELKSQLKRSNGGRPYPNCFMKDGEVWIVSQFYSISHGPKATRFEDAFQTLVIDGMSFFPRDLLPIAEDPGGDIYCISTNPKLQAKIFGWQHEKYNDPDQSVVELCDGLDEFINSFIECP